MKRSRNFLERKIKADKGNTTRWNKQPKTEQTGGLCPADHRRMDGRWWLYQLNKLLTHVIQLPNFVYAIMLFDYSLCYSAPIECKDMSTLIYKYRSIHIYIRLFLYLSNYLLAAYTTPPLHTLGYLHIFHAQLYLCVVRLHFNGHTVRRRRVGTKSFVVRTVCVIRCWPVLLMPVELVRLLFSPSLRSLLFPLIFSKRSTL